MAAAIATLIFDGIESALKGLYPNIEVRKRKGLPSSHPESALCGWIPGDPSPCFVVTCPDPELVNEYDDFENIVVRYPVTIAYVKGIQGASVPRDDDDDIRQVRQTLRDNFEAPNLPGVSDVFNVECHTKEPYSAEAGGTPVVSVSAEQFEYFTFETLVADEV